jgi:DNA invertase Pin-like site-specific DNA recombinase
LRRFCCWKTMRVISALKLDAEHAWCDAAGKCFLDMLGLFAEFETNLRRERISRGSPRPRLRASTKAGPPR